MDAHTAFRQGGRASAATMVAGEALAGSRRDARTLRHVAGSPVVTDGPYAETVEQLGGFYLIDVDSTGRRARPVPAAPRRLRGRGPAGDPHRGL